MAQDALERGKAGPDEKDDESRAAESIDRDETEGAVEGGAFPSTSLDPAGKRDPSPERRAHKKVAALIVVVLVFLVGVGLVYSFVSPGDAPMTVVTSSSLKKAISIDELSTAEFVYNGIAEKKSAEGDEVEFRIAYNATVKAGVRMSDIDFTIDEESKSVHPVLPAIVINGVEIDVNHVEYMPSNPNTDLQEVLTICKEDATVEANEDSNLQSVAQENLRAVVEALTRPILDSGGYELVWDEPASELVQSAMEEQKGIEPAEAEGE